MSERQNRTPRLKQGIVYLSEKDFAQIIAQAQKPEVTQDKRIAFAFNGKARHFLEYLEGIKR